MARVLLIRRLKDLSRAIAAVARVIERKSKAIDHR